MLKRLQTGGPLGPPVRSLGLAPPPVGYFAWTVRFPPLTAIGLAAVPTWWYSAPAAV